MFKLEDEGVYVSMPRGDEGLIWVWSHRMYDIWVE
jgi:hypothetical protein